MNGIINVYKEAGFTSFDVVAKLRGMLKTKKIGHTGTLDPEAVGVLPVCVGNATRVVELLTDRTKEYVAVMRLGVVTDTQDMTGEVLTENYEAAASLEDSVIRDTILSFQGEIEQIPPMYSALKVNGQKLVDLARKGIEVERKPRKVSILEIELLDSALSDSVLSDSADKSDSRDREDSSEGTFREYSIRVVCSKGTYIRTLIHDIGQKLGCGAAMVHLERTRVGEFGKDTALTLGQIQELVDASSAGSTASDASSAGSTASDASSIVSTASDASSAGSTASDALKDVLIPVDIMFQEYPALKVTESGMKALLNGNQLQPGMVALRGEGGNLEECSTLCKPELVARQVYKMYSYDNQFCALYEYHGGWKVLTPVKMFL